MSRLIRSQRTASNARAFGATRNRAVSVVEIPLDEPGCLSSDAAAGTGFVSRVSPLSGAPPYATRHSSSGATHRTPDPRSLITEFVHELAETVCVRLNRLVHAATSAPPIRVTVIAAAIFLAAIVTAHVARGEIDLTKLMPGAEQITGHPLVVIQNGKLTNTGDVPALNVEVTKPRYRLLGTLAPGQSLDLPADNFAVQFEWSENGQTRRATRSFAVSNSSTTNARVAGHADNGQVSVAQTGSSTNAAAPEGITATYDPATHMLTVIAKKSVEVRVDGFLLRPVSRTDKDGAQFRYVQANVLVLGQDIRQGDTVAFEVVFTKPQDFYSIPIYVHEPGKPAAYFTVSVATSPRTSTAGSGT